MLHDFIMQDEDGNDVNVQVELKRVPSKAEPILKNLFGNWYVNQDQASFGGDFKIGTIENLVLRFGVKTVYTDMANPGTREMKPVKRFDANDPWSTLPDLRDDETGKSLPEHTLKLLINMKANRWIAQHDRYKMVFGNYLEEQEETKDPIEDTSTNGSSSTSLMAVSPTPE